MITAHVEYAFQPREGARSAGGYHAILDQPLTAGRLVRERGDALCRPRRKFWGLAPGNDTGQPTCPPCKDRVARYGVTMQERKQ